MWHNIRFVVKHTVYGQFDVHALELANGRTAQAVSKTGRQEAKKNLN